MAKVKSTRRAYLRGVAQAFDLGGVIGSRRLQGIRDKSVGDALGADWRKVTRRLDNVVGRWVSRASDNG